MTHAHDHQWIEFARFSYAPISVVDPIAHTAFFVLVCADNGCSAVSVFPGQNFSLATPTFRTHLNAILKGMGRDPLT